MQQDCYQSRTNIVPRQCVIPKVVFVALENMTRDDLCKCGRIGWIQPSA